MEASGQRASADFVPPAAQRGAVGQTRKKGYRAPAEERIVRADLPARQETYEVTVSVPLVLEYEGVLLRHVAASPFTESDVRILIDYICAIAVQQEVFFLWRPFLRDPGDDLVLELAIAARCEAIVTHNIRDFRGAEKLGVSVVTPGTFLQQLRGQIWVP